MPQILTGLRLYLPLSFYLKQQQNVHSCFLNWQSFTFILGRLS